MGNDMLRGFEDSREHSETTSTSMLGLILVEV